MLAFEPVLMSVLVICSGLVSGSETALFSLNSNSLSENQRRDRLVLSLIGDSRNLLSILITNNVINVAYFALVSSWANDVNDRIAEISIFFGSLTTLILFGEIIPKVLASGAPTIYARTLAPALWLICRATAPCNALVHRILHPILRDDTEDGKRVNSDELKLVIEHSRDHGVVSELIHDRLIEVVDLAETPAKSVMTHRIDLPVITQQSTADEARSALAAKPGPFLLLVDEHEECLGIIAVQDLLRGGRPGKRSRKPLFIPDSVDLAQVLTLLQENNRNVAVVIDEYGGTAGLISLAHIGNELLGPGLSTELPDMDHPNKLTTIIGISLDSSSSTIGKLCSPMSIPLAVPPSAVSWLSN